MKRTPKPSRIRIGSVISSSGMLAIADAHYIENWWTVGDYEVAEARTSQGFGGAILPYDESIHRALAAAAGTKLLPEAAVAVVIGAELEDFAYPVYAVVGDDGRGTVRLLRLEIDFQDPHPAPAPEARVAERTPAHRITPSA